MNRDLPQSRRRARAVAISDSARRASSLRTGLMLLTGTAALAEVALLLQKLCFAHA